MSLKKKEKFSWLKKIFQEIKRSPIWESLFFKIYPKTKGPSTDRLKISY